MKKIFQLMLFAFSLLFTASIVEASNNNFEKVSTNSITAEPQINFASSFAILDVQNQSVLNDDVETYLDGQIRQDKAAFLNLTKNSADVKTLFKEKPSWRTNNVNKFIKRNFTSKYQHNSAN